MIDFAILTIADAERDALLSEFGFGDHHRTQIDNRVYWRGTLSVGTDEEYSVVITKCHDAGNLDAQAAVTACVQHFRPQAAILVGIAGGCSEQQAAGDVVLARHAYYYERGKAIEHGQLSEPYMIPADGTLWAAADNLPNWKPKLLPPPADLKRLPVVHKGVIASGELVVADAKFRDEIKSGHRKIEAVEMEGYGFSKGCFESTKGVKWLVVRAISDFGDKAKSDLWHHWAMAVAADFVKTLLLARPIPPLKKRRHRSRRSRVSRSCRLQKNVRPRQARRGRLDHIPFTGEYAGRPSVRRAAYRLARPD